jgi:hypothetical protein
MKRFLLAFSLLFVPMTGYAKINCQKNPIFCAMKELNPSINVKWGFQLSNYIHKYSKIYKIDPYISVAIAMQESGLRPINRYQSILIKDAEDKFVKIKGISDIGVWQLHVDTVDNYKLCAERLLTDLKYATKSHFLILSRKIKNCRHLKDEAWSCYHSITERHRAVYKDLVMRFYKGGKKDER